MSKRTVFSAGLVIYAFELLNHAYKTHTTESAFLDSGQVHLHKAVEAMSKLDADNPITNGCAKYIVHLFEILQCRTFSFYCLLLSASS
jgi:hypothetical protein